MLTSKIRDKIVLVLGTLLAIVGIFFLGMLTDQQVPGFVLVLLGGVLFAIYLYWYLFRFHRHPRNL